MDLASSDPCLCARACQDDPSCQAFTYAPAGFSGVQARCWLKNAVPARVSCESCISGIKRTEPGDERWGSPDCRTPAVPRLSFTRSEGTTTADGNRATIFWFSVDNRVDYSASLFTSAPDLPPCGSNTASSRTWISIYNQDGTYINGFCALSSPDELADLSFTIPDGQTVPHSIYVSVQDRRCNVSSSSADLAIPGMTPIPSPCPSSLPAPILVLTPHIVEGHLLYDWKVTNGDEYPDSLFPCDASGCRLTLDFIYEDGTILYSGQVTSREYLERSGIQIPADPGHTSIQLMVKDSVCALSSRSENTPIPNLATPSPDTTAPPASSCPDFPSGLLPHTDLPGSDYRSMDLASSDPCLCARACQDDPTCQAFTFAPAGFSGPEARCWLKNAVPARASCESCISGIKGSVPGDRGERTPDCSALPVPVITYTRSEPTTTADGERGTIFWFSVDNRDEYSASLFTSAPDLPPCGSNTASSRTWISIYNQDGTDMNGFCALSSPDELADLSFTIIEGNPVPGSIYITLEDRRCGLTSRSGSLPIPGISSPGRVILPAPVQVSPEDGATFHNYPRNVVFRWDPVIGAASYTLEVDCYHCCVSDQWCSDVGTIFAVEPGITGTSHEIEFVGQQNGRWRVWGVDSAGNEGVKSPWRLFTYQI